MQNIQRDLPARCQTNADELASYNAKAEAAIQTLKEGVAESNAPILIRAVAKLEEMYAEGLKKSHQMTIEYYEKAAEEQRKVFAALD